MLKILLSTCGLCHMGTASSAEAAVAPAPSSCSFGGSKRSSLGSDHYGTPNAADSRLRRSAAEDEISQRKFEWQCLTSVENEKNQDCQFMTDYASGCSESNFCKNRYTSVLALEKTRVRLHHRQPHQDYINANYVDGIHQDSRKAYIATQAPLPDTFGDFWRMVWDQNTHIIVMLTRLVEGGRIKADRYWPTSRPKRFGDVSIRLESIEPTNYGYKVKKFQLERPGHMPRTVFQYHFLDWPDHGVPTDPSHLLHMMQRIDDHSKQLEEQDSEELLTDTSSSGHSSDNETESDSEAQPEGRLRSPLLVHCSAGIGRTGAFIVIHTVLHKLREEAKLVNDVDMKTVVASIRSQRSGVLTGLCQYTFCCDAVKQGLAAFRQPQFPAQAEQLASDSTGQCSFKSHAVQLAAKLSALSLALTPSKSADGFEEDDEPSDCEEEELLSCGAIIDQDGVLIDPVSKHPIAQNSQLGVPVTLGGGATPSGCSSNWFMLASEQSPCGSPRKESSAPVPVAGGSLSGSSCWWSSSESNSEYSSGKSWYTTTECTTPLSSSQ